MALATEISIRKKIVETIRATIPGAKVYSRVRIPAEGRLEDFARLVTDDEKRIHVWFVRRAQRQVAVDSFNVVVSVVQDYQLFGLYSFVDDENDDLASEERFQAEIEMLASAFEAGPTFLLDGVTHRGLSLTTNFTDVKLGDFLCHEAICRLIVDVEDC